MQDPSGSIKSCTKTCGHCGMQTHKEPRATEWYSQCSQLHAANSHACGLWKASQELSPGTRALRVAFGQLTKMLLHIRICCRRAALAAHVQKSGGCTRNMNRALLLGGLLQIVLWKMLARFAKSIMSMVIVTLGTFETMRTGSFHTRAGLAGCR